MENGNNVVTVDVLRQVLNEVLEPIHKKLDRIEAAQNEDVIAILKAMNHSIEGLKRDIEYTVKEQAIIKLEVDRSKRVN